MPPTTHHSVSVHVLVALGYIGLSFIMCDYVGVWGWVCLYSIAVAPCMMNKYLFAPYPWV